MKYKKIIVAIIVFVATIVLAKNYFIEFFIYKKLSSNNILAKNVSCEGIYKINCNINSLSYRYKDKITTYKVSINNVKLTNLVNIYKSYKAKDFFKYKYQVTINKIQLNDSRKIFDELAKPLFVTFNADKQEIYIKSYNDNINIHFFKNKKIYITTNIKNSAIKNILYEMYKLKFTELKQTDGKEIAKGINISLGVSTDKLIKKELFFDKSIHRFIDLLISEIEVLDIYSKYNKNDKLSDLLYNILIKDGYNKYEIDF